MEQIMNNPPAEGEEGDLERFDMLRDATPNQSDNEQNNDSDPEDPKYLAKLCQPFSRKIKKQNGVIAMLQNILLNTQSMARAREAQLKVLTRQVKKLKSSNAQGRHNLDELVGRDPSALLLEELWLLIFEKLDDAEDIFSCYKTCSFFRDGLDTTKQYWMFQLAFPIILENLTKSDILNCRLVCKRWRHGVDYLLENHETRRPYNSSFHSTKFSRIASPYRNILARKGLEKIINPHIRIQEILDELIDTDERQPIIVGRAVTFAHSAEIDQPQDVFWGRVERFLQCHGKDIYQVNILSSVEISEANFLNIISQLLAYLPNLRHLGISAKSRVQENFIPNMELLPELPNLESLFVLFPQNDLKLEGTLISKYYNQLGKLETSKWNTEFSSLEMPNLKELKIHLEQWGQRSGFPHEHREFSTSPFLNNLLSINKCSIHIEKLVLGPIGTEECVKLLFKVLYKLPKLGVLRVWFGAVSAMTKTGGEMEEIVRRLSPDIVAPPNLHTLEIDQSFKSLDYVFLTRFPLIQMLHIRHDDGTNIHNMLMDVVGGRFGNRSEFVQVHRYLSKGEMYRSNIWGMLPNLTIITYMYPGRPAHHGHPAKPAYSHMYHRHEYELSSLCKRKNSTS